MSYGNEGSAHGSICAIVYALGANFGIAVAKYIAAFWTGSGSMLADAINAVEARMQERFPSAQWVFFEPDTR